MTPVVSVVLSTYNRREKLQRAVNSVLAQTLSDIEIIIVDNASTDDTQEAVRGINDGRIRYIRHETNLGGPAARNTGIKNAKASYIALLDDDDEWMPRKLEKQVQKFQQNRPPVGLIYVGSEIYNENTKKVQDINYPQFRGNVYERLLLSTIIGSCSSVLVKKECFQKVGMFDEELTSCQDWDMWLRIAGKYEFDFVPDVLARINEHGSQISTDYAALIPGRTKMVRKHWQEFERYPRVFVVHLKRIGKLHCINGTWVMAWEWFYEAIKVNPMEIFKILGWCVFELPRVKYFSGAKNFKRYIPS